MKMMQIKKIITVLSFASLFFSFSAFAENEGTQTHTTPQEEVQETSTAPINTSPAAPTTTAPAAPQITTPSTQQVPEARRNVDSSADEEVVVPPPYKG